MEKLSRFKGICVAHQLLRAFSVKLIDVKLLVGNTVRNLIVKLLDLIHCTKSKVRLQSSNLNELSIFVDIVLHSFDVFVLVRWHQLIVLVHDFNHK